MAQSSLSDNLYVINNLVLSQETLLQHHFKAQALMHIALKDDFFSCSTIVMHDYLCVLSEIIDQAKVLNENLLNTLVEFSHRLT